MDREGQAMCCFSGVNSIYVEDKSLSTSNSDVNEDMKIFERLGLKPQNHLQKK